MNKQIIGTTLIAIPSIAKAFRIINKRLMFIKEAIERLIKILLDVEPEKFDLGGEYKGFKEGQAPSVNLLENTCGATACAAGHAALDPWFQNQGFLFTTDGSNYFFLREEILLEILGIERNRFNLIFGYDGIINTSIFYNINGISNITPKMVAAKLQELLDAES